MNFAEAVYHHFYRRRKRQSDSARVTFSGTCIVSIGNLTTGGTGKTPAVQWLARRLQLAGLKTAIVARGYGGELSAQGAIVSDGQKILLSARQAGDEAVLHARALEYIPVIIGRDRVAATRVAIDKFAPQVVLLDDGFQFWSLARDFDLVLMDARHPFGKGKLLPVGRLREPQSELRRASAVLLTRADLASESELERTIDEVRCFSDAPIFRASHAPVRLRDEATGELHGLEVLQGKRVSALSALASNEPFFQSLHERGADVVHTLSRRDHYAWQENEVRAFAREAIEKKTVQAIVTTEKDAVKIDADWLAPLPLWSLQIELKIENEDALWQLISGKIHL